jgi:peptide/nickel transport system permease protein
MLRYILGRLLLMIPTLFGITLVTFGIVNMLPGKPGQAEEQMKKGVSPEVAEAQRRRYFFDLPLFFNTAVEDGPVAAQKLIGRATVDPNMTKEQLSTVSFLTLKEQEQFASLTDPVRLHDFLRDIRERGQQNLIKYGGAALPIFFAEFETYAAKLSPEELEKILAGLTKIPASADLTNAPTRWKGWWAQSQGKFDAEHIQSKVEDFLKETENASGASAQDYLRAADQATLQELRLIGTFGLAPLINVTQNHDFTDQEAGAAAALLSDITGASFSFAPDDLTDENYEKVDNVGRNWREWWKQYRRDYDAYSGTEKAVGFISETQYFKWMVRVVTFEFGNSQIQAGRQVLDIITDSVPNTLRLSLVSLFLAYLIAIPLGVSSAVRQGSFFDQASTLILFILYSMPSFWVALMLILLFCGQGTFDWFPVTGLHSSNPADYPAGSAFLDTIWHMVLPVVCLTYGSFASLSRYMRVGVLDVLRQDYVRTARAKGLAERVVIWKHAVRNSLLPVITLLGIQIPFLVGGSVLVEQIFQIDGMGYQTFAALSSRDYPVVMAVAVLTAIATMISLLISDILYALADPRISYK